MSDEIIRRDPRAEWIARNRLHPQHAAMVEQVLAEVRGPSGLIRRNPHAVGFIGPNGIKRIDRLNTDTQAGSGARRKATKRAELPLHRVETPDYYIAVVPDFVGGRLTSHDRDVLGQAHQLIREIGGAGAVLAIIFGESREESFDRAGVDRLMHLTGENYAGYAPEACVAALEQVEQLLSPRFWLFPDSVSGGFEIGCRLAARLDERIITQAWQVDLQTTFCRGAGGTSDISRPTERILLMVQECADPIDETRHEVLAIEAVQPKVLKSTLEDLGQVAVDPNSVALGEAEFILSAGNGVHDWDNFHHAATVLGATEAGSRVVVDDGHMPRFRQVGASGTWVTARVYLAVGISGAVQHLQGIAQCDKVVAINTDIGCDMVKRAALSVIDDSDEVLCELIKLVQEFRQREVTDAA